MATAYRSTDYQLTGGASFRMVADVGNWDASVAINTPGQSGDPASPHYRDLAPLWAEGRYFPLAYSRDAVEKATRTRFELKSRQADSVARRAPGASLIFRTCSSE